MTVFYLLIVSHLVADFFLQGPIAFKKRGLNKYMLVHVLIVTISFLIPLYNHPLAKTLLGALVIFMSHLTVDIIKVEIGRLLKLGPNNYLFWFFFGADQIIHISVIYLVVNQFL